MDLKRKLFRNCTEKASFDINAGQNLQLGKSIKEVIEDVVNYIDSGNKGCCFHASVYLIKLLHDNGISATMILTPEPTILANGETRIDNRASVLIKENDRYVVMNPIEDVEFFEKYSISPEKRGTYYEEDTTVLKYDKEKIYSVDAADIDLEDFISRYGDGQAWTIDNLFCEEYDTKTFNSLLANAHSVDLKKLKEGHLSV